MAKKAGQIVINVTAGTAQFVQDLENAKGGVRRFAKDVGDFQAKHGKGLNIRFALLGAKDFMEGRGMAAMAEAINEMTSIKGAAFAGAVMGIGAIGYAAYEATQYVKELAEAPARIAGAFRELNSPLRLTNDELRVTNDRLENDIAKLEGRRQNTLKLALDEARVSADKLADSLDKGLSTLLQMLDKTKLGFWTRLTGEEGGKLERMIGGHTGFGGFRRQISDITYEGNKRVAEATTVDEQRAARLEMNSRLTRVFSDEIEKLNVVIEKNEALKTKGVFTENGRSTFATGGTNYGEIADQAREARAALQGMVAQVPLRDLNEELTKQKDALEAQKKNADLMRPFEDRVRNIKADIAGLDEKLATVGKPEAFRVAAEAAREAERAISQINNELDRVATGMRLKPNQQRELRDLFGDEASRRAALEWRTNLESNRVAIDQSVKSLQMLSDAIGKGYEATKRANVETQVMERMKERYNDQAFAADRAALSAQLAAEYEARHAQQSAQNTYTLEEEIKVQNLLADAQRDGEEEIRRITALEIWRQGILRGATGREIVAEITAYYAKIKTQSAGEVARIEAEVAAIQRLSTAQLEGAEAARKAGLENKYAEMQRTGHGAEVPSMRARDEAEWQASITSSVARRLNHYNDQIAQLDRERAKLVEIVGLHQATADQERVLRDLEDDRLRIAVDQELAQRGAANGVRAFFLEMEMRGKSAAQTVYEALNSAVDRISDSMSRVLTGQSGDWKRAFQEIAQGYFKDTISSGIRTTLGNVGRAFGINVDKLTGAKPDGSKERPFWVRMDNPAFAGFGAEAGAGWNGGDQQSGGLFGGGSIGRFIFSALGLTPRAAGGPVSAASAYLVGENGPEILTGVSGNILNATASQRVLGGAGNTHYYSIDARGTDPVLTEMRVRNAIVQAHTSAVATSAAVQQDRMRRIPQAR